MTVNFLERASQFGLFQKTSVHSLLHTMLICSRRTVLHFQAKTNLTLGKSSWMFVQNLPKIQTVTDRTICSEQVSTFTGHSSSSYGATVLTTLMLQRQR